MARLLHLVEASEKESPETRLTAALDALKAARRPDEKKQAVAVLAAINHAKAAGAIQPSLADAELREDAGQAAIALARKLARSDAATAKALAQAVKSAEVSDDLRKKAQAIIDRCTADFLVCCIAGFPACRRRELRTCSG